MSRHNDRDGAKERFWRRMVQQWHRSGQTIRDFCRDQGLSEPNFYAWRRTIAERDADTVTFAPVHVVPDATDGETPSGGAALELVLAGGRVLRVAPGFDAATLERLLALLEEGRP